MSISVKLSAKTVDSARKQAKVFHRTLGGQIDYWAQIGAIAEHHPYLTFAHLQQLMRNDQLDTLLSDDAKQQKTKQFNAVKINTSNYRFDREEANAR